MTKIDFNKPFTPPKGLNIVDLKQLKNDEELPTLKTEHSVIEAANEQQILTILTLLNIPTKNLSGTNQLKNKFYEAYYNPQFLKWLISFIDPRINQAFIDSTYFSRNDLLPQIWVHIQPTLNTLSQLGIVFFHKDSNNQVTYEAPPAYTEILATLASKDSFGAVNHYNVFITDLINSILNTYGLMSQTSLIQLLHDFKLIKNSSEEKLLQLIHAIPNFSRLFGFDGENFVLKRYNSEEKRQKLLEQQKPFPRFKLESIKEALQIQYSVTEHIADSKLENELKRLLTVAKKEVGPSFAFVSINELFNVPYPLDSALFKLLDQLNISIEPETKEQLQRYFRELMVYKHIPELNGHSLITLRALKKTKK